MSLFYTTQRINSLLCTIPKTILNNTLKGANQGAREGALSVAGAGLTFSVYLHVLFGHRVDVDSITTTTFLAGTGAVFGAAFGGIAGGTYGLLDGVSQACFSKPLVALSEAGQIITGGIKGAAYTMASSYAYNRLSNSHYDTEPSVAIPLIASGFIAGITIAAVKLSRSQTVSTAHVALFSSVQPSAPDFENVKEGKVDARYRLAG